MDRSVDAMNAGEFLTGGETSVVSVQFSNEKWAVRITKHAAVCTRINLS